jgi:hypothetical protein
VTKEQCQAALQNLFLHRENPKKYRPRLLAISRVNPGTLRDISGISSIAIDNWTRNIWPCYLSFYLPFHEHSSLCNEIEPILTGAQPLSSIVERLSEFIPKKIFRI